MLGAVQMERPAAEDREEQDDGERDPGRGGNRCVSDRAERGRRWRREVGNRNAMDLGEPGMNNSKRPLNPNFVLNQSRYLGATILLTRKNFGCGSSREHAPWALQQFCFRAIIAPSYADIFFNNCFKNGLLPIVLTELEVDHLFNIVSATVGLQLSVDLDRQTVQVPGAQVYKFDVEDSRKQSLLNGWDEIGRTLRHSDKIKSYEAARATREPWLFN